MCTNVLAELEFDVSTAKRAQYEAFEFALEAPGLVRVTNGSYGADADDHSYHVNVENGVPVVCECPSDEYRAGACKHRVAVAIRTPVLDAACDDGDRPVATDGGVIEAGDEDEVIEDNEGDPERPDDCQCSPLFDDLPCWPCYRDGFDSPNPDVGREDGEGDGRQDPQRSERADFGGGESTGVVDLL